MLRRFTSLIVLLAAIVGFMPVAMATDTPEKLIIKVSNDVLALVEKYRDTYKKDPKPLQNELLRILDPVTDFESFSKGVMGEYYDQATPAQRAQFQTDFKATLVDLYTKALVAFEVKEMGIQETIMRNPTTAKVVMRVTSPEDAVYFVQYSMRKTDDKGWQARNVILDGVNLGLTYRNQFKSAMDTENGDLAKVVANWASSMQNNTDEDDGVIKDAETLKKRRASK